MWSHRAVQRSLSGFDSFFCHCVCIYGKVFMCVNANRVHSRPPPPLFPVRQSQLCRASTHLSAVDPSSNLDKDYTLRAAFPHCREGDRRETLGTLIYHKGVFDPSNPCIEGHSIRKMPVDNINSANTNQSRQCRCTVSNGIQPRERDGSAVVRMMQFIT